MKNNSGRVIQQFVLFFLVLTFISCKKQEKIRITVLPEKIKAELHFRGFVTDEREELVSQIHEFSKLVTSKDTLNGQPVFVYIAEGKKIYFYTDEDYTVWEKNINDISARIITYGFSYQAPVILSDWEILLKVKDGVGTKWEASIDTTFDALTLSGEKQKIRFVKKGKARFDGWSQTFLPELYVNIDVLDACWYDLKTYIINVTTSDTLFATDGIAHQYFLPEVGAVKYITNFTKHEKNQPEVKLRGTWELMRRDIPE